MGSSIRILDNPQTDLSPARAKEQQKLHLAASLFPVFPPYPTPPSPSIAQIMVHP
jgi:hypothetical protein